MKSSEQILWLLKTRGPVTTALLAQLLELSTMGARRQLESLLVKRLVQCNTVADKVGRPSQHWLLTSAGHARFPDRHAELTLQMITQVRALFGEEGLERLIAARETDTEATYNLALAGAHTLQARAEALAQAREREGYMAAALAQPDGSVLLVENHCPICAAASACQQFCRSELAVFQRVLGAGTQVARSEHMLAGQRRCAYLITAQPLLHV